MKPEAQIDQKKLLELIKRLNKEHKAKIKTKGSITELAEAFAEAVELLAEQGLPEEVIDFFNDLFADESAGYKGVEVVKDDDPEPDPVDDAEPLPEPEPADDVEELPELDPEEELPGEEEEPVRPEPEPEEEEELEELEEEEPPKKAPVNRKPQPKQTAKAAPPKKEETMIEKLDAITKKPELKAFVKEHNINVKLKNSESLQVWKAKIKKTICPAPAPAKPEKAAKPAAKPAAKAKAEPKATKEVKTKAEPKKPAKKSDRPKISRGEKDPFGITVGSLTHKFVQTVLKKPTTMKQIEDAGMGKHPKTVKKLIAMGYMERDKSGLLNFTAKGRKVYQGGK